MGKNNLRTKTKSKNKKRQTCAPGVHVDDRSVNSRPNSEGVNKTVNTPAVKRDFSAYASPKIHFTSSMKRFAQDSHALTPFPPCGGSVTNDSPTPRQGGGLTHAPLRAWDPKRTTQLTEGTPPASGKGAFDVGCRVGGGNSPHLRPFGLKPKVPVRRSR